MALITCEECRKIYSDKAIACPECACPTNFNVKIFPNTGFNEELVDDNFFIYMAENNRASDNKEADKKCNVYNELPKKRKEACEGFFDEKPSNKYDYNDGREYDFGYDYYHYYNSDDEFIDSP